MLRNDGISFVERKTSKSEQWMDKESTERILYSEAQVFPKNVKFYCAPLMQWHFPAVKQRRHDFIEHLDLLELAEFKQLNMHLLDTLIPSYMLQESVIEEIYARFV